jgi:hypothetical protein
MFDGEPAPKSNPPPKKTTAPPPTAETVVIKTKPQQPSGLENILSLDDLRVKKSKHSKTELSDDEDMIPSDDDDENEMSDEDDMDPFANQADLELNATEIEVVEKTSMKVDAAFAFLKEQINNISSTFSISESAGLAILKHFGFSKFDILLTIKDGKMKLLLKNYLMTWIKF